MVLFLRENNTWSDDFAGRWVLAADGFCNAAPVASAARGPIIRRRMRSALRPVNDTHNQLPTRANLCMHSSGLAQFWHHDWGGETFGSFELVGRSGQILLVRYGMEIFSS